MICPTVQEGAGLKISCAMLKRGGDKRTKDPVASVAINFLLGRSFDTGSGLLSGWYGKV
jgi:hypothetical protein